MAKKKPAATTTETVADSQEVVETTTTEEVKEETTESTTGAEETTEAAATESDTETTEETSSTEGSDETTNEEAPAESADAPAATESETSTTESAPAVEEVKEPEPVVAPVVEALKEEIVTPAPEPVVAAAPKTPAEINALVIVQELEEYAKMMAPNVPHPSGEGPIQQVCLYRTIQKILRKEGEDFTNSMDTLLNFIHAKRSSLFSEYYAFRYFEEMQLGARDRLNFTRLLNLFITVCDQQSRSLTLKQVDLTKTLEMLEEESARQRVMSYFGNNA